VNKSINARLAKLEQPKAAPDREPVGINWDYDRDLCEWHREDGTIEAIPQKEFKARGGRVIDWAKSWDDLMDQVLGDIVGIKS